MKKNIVIDDFGRTPEVSKSILKIVNNLSNICEISVMLGFVNLSFHKKLKLTNIDISLHLNLTDNISIENIGKNLSFINLLILPKKKRIFVFKEIENQIRNFQKLYNLKKITINSHEHVHTIPWIYRYLYKHKNIKNIRYIDENFFFVKKKISIFELIRNYLAFIFVKVLNIFNKKKSNKYFIGLIYSNNMCRKVYNKIINKYSYSNIEILFHPGGGNKNEIDYFSSKKYYNYFTSKKRINEFNELYKIK